MGSITYTDHLHLRLKVRRIPEDYPRKIYRNPEQVLIDQVEGYTIAIKKLDYNNKVRNMMIAYEESGEDITIITIHPISEEKVVNRKNSGRWADK